MSVYPKRYTDSMQLKFQQLFFPPEVGKLIPKFIRASNSQNNAKNKVGRLTLPNFTICYSATLVVIVWQWHKDRHTDQWNRRESLEINPHIYGQLIFNKDAKTI